MRAWIARIGVSLIAFAAWCVLLRCPSRLATARDTRGAIAAACVPEPGAIRFAVAQECLWVGRMNTPVTYNRAVRLTSREDITACRAMIDCSRNPAMDSTMPDTHLGFVTRDGTVVIFALSRRLGVSRKLGLSEPQYSQLERIIRRSRYLECSNAGRSTRLPTAEIQELDFHRQDQSVRVPLSGEHGARVRSAWWRLMSCFDPLSLQDNTECTHTELQEMLHESPWYFRAKPAHTMRFHLVVVPVDMKAFGPPTEGDTRPRLLDVACDEIYLCAANSRQSRLVRFVFSSATTGQCIASGWLWPRDLLGVEEATPIRLPVVDPNQVLENGPGIPKAALGPDLSRRLITQVEGG